MSWWSEFLDSFLSHLKEEFTVGDIGEEINEAILQVKQYVTIGDYRVMLTDAVIVTWIAVAIFVLLFAILSARPVMKPGTKQTFVEMLVELVLSTAQGFGLTREEACHIAPMIGTFAIVITGCNTISVFDVAPPAKNIGFPIGMALCSIFYVTYVSIRFVGFKGFWKSLVTPVAFLLPFKILDMIVKPCSLALRLFGNVFGAFVFMEFIHIVLPIIVPGVLGLWFDLADGALQAVIFSYLTMYYIGEIVEVGHELKEHPERFQKQKKEKKNKKKAGASEVAAV
ncbi:MAG: F0F1 ATP synthase subunit A [Clostridiales bacterium]|nr:F0F1 ATP synthase subunit A [Clostridiales bacterium]